EDRGCRPARDQRRRVYRSRPASTVWLPLQNKARPHRLKRAPRSLRSPTSILPYTLANPMVRNPCQESRSVVNSSAVTTERWPSGPGGIPEQPAAVPPPALALAPRRGVLESRACLRCIAPEQRADL